MGIIVICMRELKRAGGQCVGEGSSFLSVCGGKGLWFCVGVLTGDLVRSQSSCIRIPLPSPLPASPG